MISPTAAIPRSPGTGEMKCCASGHVKTGADGTQYQIPCMKEKMGPIMIQMLASYREYHLGLNDLINYRVWTAMTQKLMKGLPSEGMPPAPQTVAEYLTQNRFSKPDDETSSSGFTPLIFASLSGNVAVVSDLLTHHKVNVKARTLIGLPKYGIERGMDALALAVAGCPQDRVHEIVSLLLGAGADPNIRFPKSGATPLMAAVLWHNLEGVRALASCAGDKLDLEIGLRINHATALLIAGHLSTFDIFETLVAAGANKGAMNDAGGTLLHAVCGNPGAGPKWLELVCGGSSTSAVDVNVVHSARNLKWKLIGKATRALGHLCISRSDLVSELSHAEGSTPVHMAARQGNYKLVKWLIEHGAMGALHVKNRRGCTPVEIARVFGPHHEIGGLLGSAMCASLADSRHKLMRRSSSGLALRVARSGKTAIPIHYPMYLMPVSELLKLSELRPHQELLAAGKLVPWDAELKTVFFLSHQWTSFSRPDHSTTQLRTVQRLLSRMLNGTLPDTGPSFLDKARFSSNVKVTAQEWKTMVPGAHVWMDFISVPQVSASYTELAAQDSADGAGQLSDLMKAVNSIPAYVERCTHFFTICPPTVRFYVCRSL